MGNKELAKNFNLLGKLLELHGENQFKVRSYYTAYNTLRKYPEEISAMEHEAIAEIQGVGKAIYGKIIELIDNGSMETLNKYLAMTPPGIVEMLMIKGLGPKKVKQLWSDLEIESPGELLYACTENRLLDLKGFGEKTQKNIKEQLEYHISSVGMFHYASLEEFANTLLGYLKSTFPKEEFSITGEFERKKTIIKELEVLGTADSEVVNTKVSEASENILPNLDVEIAYNQVQKNKFAKEAFIKSCDTAYLAAFKFDKVSNWQGTAPYDEQGLPFHQPELREADNIVWLKKEKKQLELVEVKDIKGVVHTHTTYSDGIHTLEEMAVRAQKMGFEYIVFTDHSQSAFYANGLKEDRLMQQFEEIDTLNKKLDINIYSGIESDILSNGALDYEDEILSMLDVIIASVHSNLKMDLEKATNRLITAIENPFTRILGHPTGRLLLSRKGYPIDYKKVIDACADNEVAIELNANPYRLDLDWRQINYALNKEVMISVNPDAHSRDGIADIKYGVFAARKGGLTADMTLNAKSNTDFSSWIDSK